MTLRRSKGGRERRREAGKEGKRSGEGKVRKEDTWISPSPTCHKKVFVSFVIYFFCLQECDERKTDRDRDTQTETKKINRNKEEERKESRQIEK